MTDVWMSELRWVWTAMAVSFVVFSALLMLLRCLDARAAKRRDVERDLAEERRRIIRALGPPSFTEEHVRTILRDCFADVEHVKVDRDAPAGMLRLGLYAQDWGRVSRFTLHGAETVVQNLAPAHVVVECYTVETDG